MTNHAKENAVQHAKIMAMIYVALSLFMALLYFASGWISTGTIDMRTRAFTLGFVAALMLALVGFQMLKCLFHSGLNPVTISLFGILNVLFIAMQLAVLADFTVPDSPELPITLVVFYLMLASIGIIVLILWMAWSWMKERRAP
ncbi:MAG: hypothetical protein ACFFD3_06715 [Candidatus Thorarchaeota archaeon]